MIRISSCFWRPQKDYKIKRIDVYSHFLCTLPEKAVKTKSLASGGMGYLARLASKGKPGKLGKCQSLDVSHFLASLKDYYIVLSSSTLSSATSKPQEGFTGLLWGILLWIPFCPSHNAIGGITAGTSTSNGRSQGLYLKKIIENK